MRKLLIIGGIVLVVLVGVVGFALANLNSWLNDNRDWVAQQAESALGRQVAFDEIGVSILGGFGARITNLRVADDPQYSKEHFVKAGRVQVGVRLLPALFGNVEVREILLESPSVKVIRTAKGFNFETIGPPAEEEAPAKPEAGEMPASGEPEAEEPAALPAFLVTLMEIENAEFDFIDRTTEPATELKIRALDFSASDVSLTEPMEVRLAVSLFGAEEQNVKANGTVGPVGSPPEPQQVPVDLEMEVGPLVLDEVKKLGKLAAAIPPELSSPDPVFLRANVTGTPQELSLETRFDADEAAIQYGDAFRKPADVPMNLSLDGTYAGTRVDVKALALQLASLRLNASGKVDTADAGSVDLHVKTDEANLDGWERLVPALEQYDVSGTAEVDVKVRGTLTGETPPTATGEVVLREVNARQEGSPYEVAGLNATVKLQKESIVLPPANFRLGGSPVELEATVRNLQQPNVRFALRSPDLRAASLALASETVKKEERIRDLSIQGRLDTAGESPSFDGTVTSSAGSLRDIDYRNLDVRLDLENQVARLEKLVLDAFEGSYRGGGRYDMTDPKNPKFDFDSTIQGMKLKPLLASQFPDAEGRMEGILAADLKLAGAGTGWETIQKTLQGNGRVNVEDGVLKDVNLAEETLTGLTGISGLSKLISPRVREKYPDVFGVGDTRFEKLGGTVQIADAKATTRDLAIAARDYEISGEGEYRFDNALDFTATFRASQRLTEDLRESAKEVKYLSENGRLKVPVQITGPLPDVKTRPDREYIAKAITRAAVDKGVEKLMDSETGEKIREGFDGIFGK